MTEKEFIIWLKGVVDSIKTSALDPSIEIINLIEKEMNNIKQEDLANKKQLLIS